MICSEIPEKPAPSQIGTPRCIIRVMQVCFRMCDVTSSPSPANSRALANPLRSLAISRTELGYDETLRKQVETIAARYGFDLVKNKQCRLKAPRPLYTAKNAPTIATKARA
ncbi:hypothetical protein [Rhizobium leguminosarum]|uniref:Uncharacterized protein n=1 Tax=Rhizobium leguminosarum TaxID=384 RepID=A0A1B1CBU5_RHILE|nr:hypothetical protein [Rhizobium leguminosarum]ANP87174.1 hypothetical protein BA011_16550 [Rhizobium leguminosarum]